MYDIAIIGTGPSAVSAYAGIRMRNRSAKICFVEAGERRVAYGGSNGVRPSSRFRLNPSIYLGYGGTSELWHYVLAPLDPIDFENRPEINSPGWPIQYSDLTQSYNSVLRMLGVDLPIEEWDATLDGSLSELELDGFLSSFEPKLFVQLKRRWRARDYLNKICEDIYFNHFVKRLKIQTDRVIIESENAAGAANEDILADKVLIAAGALNTPQILYNSDVSPAVRRNIGRTLLDHPMGVGMQLKRDKVYNFVSLQEKKVRSIIKKLHLD